MTEETIRDVIVIGAGISGLSAAKLLSESGQDILVLEANARVGGRTLNHYDKAIDYVDCGGAYMGPTQDRIYRLSKEVGVENFFCYDDGIPIDFHRGKWRTMYGMFPDSWNPFQVMDLYHMYHAIDDMGKKINMAAPWDFPEAEEWDSMTVKEWAEKTFWFQLTRDVVKSQCQLGFCCEDTELSLLYFLWYIKGGCGFLRFTSTENGAQERKFVGGSQTISLNMAARLGEDRVLLSHPVTTISQENDTVTVTTLNGKSFKSRYIIIALPPAMQNKIAFTPALPPLRNQLNQRYPMGSVIKTQVYYSRPFWRDSNYSGLAVADGIVCGTQDDCKPNAKYPAIIGFVAGDAARECCEVSKEERKQKICQHYAKILKSDEALKPVMYIEKNWMEEPYIGGGYVGYTVPGIITKYWKALREPIGRLYFAGTETATKWSGYMDGAVQAGERAAREILHNMGKISSDEVWQEEPEAQDMPALPFAVSWKEKFIPSVSGFLRFVGTCVVLAGAGGAAWVHKDKLQKVFAK
ncbi:amine oxidase [flavin-containing]-like [Diadema antillarum]|uniref:amine oxidase [flavin-containing]-like n=1 Tax=Diadema antillarum TaxID=105358 RepID=UPI003A85040C